MPFPPPPKCTVSHPISGLALLTTDSPIGLLRGRGGGGGGSRVLRIELKTRALVSDVPPFHLPGRKGGRSGRRRDREGGGRERQGEGEKVCGVDLHTAHDSDLLVLLVLLL